MQLIKQQQLFETMFSEHFDGDHQFRKHQWNNLFKNSPWIQ